MTPRLNAKNCEDVEHEVMQEGSNMCPPYGIIDVEGKCQNCPKDYFPDAHKKECIAKTCTKYQIITTEGQCQECDPWTYPDSWGRKCLAKKECNQFKEFINENGECQRCEDGKYPEENGKECAQESCGPYQIPNYDFPKFREELVKQVQAMLQEQQVTAEVDCEDSSRCCTCPRGYFPDVDQK